MTKESLQTRCNEEGLKIKILFIEKTEYENYEVVYTFDMGYQCRNSYENYIIEPELDELVKDEENKRAVSLINETPKVRTFESFTLDYIYEE